MRLLLSLAILLIAVAVGAAVPVAAGAEEPGKGELAQLRAEVAELRRALAELPSALDRLHDLENRIEALERSSDRWSGSRAAEADVRGAIDALRADAVEERRRLAAVENHAVSPIAAVAYDRGVLLRAGTAHLTVNGALQARIVGEQSRSFPGVDSFDVHHAALSLEGEVGSWVAARIAIDFGAAYFPAAAFAVRGGLLRDAYLDVRPLPWLALRAGQFTVPFGRQRMIRHGLVAAAERNLTTLAFTVDRDIGAMIEARPFGDRVLAQVSLTDGINAGERGARNDNIDFRYVAHVAVSPLGAVAMQEGDPDGGGPARALPRVTVGGGVLYDLSPTNDPVNADRNGDGRVDNVEVFSATAELALSWWRLSAQAEYFYRRENYGTLAPVPLRSYQGFYVQTQAVVIAGYGLIEAHLAYAEPHTLATAAAIGATPPPPFGSAPAANASVLDTAVPTTAWNVGGSLVAFYHSHDWKLQATLDWHRRLLPLASVGEVDALVLQVQATVGF